MKGSYIYALQFYLREKWADLHLLVMFYAACVCNGFWLLWFAPWEMNKEQDYSSVSGKPEHVLLMNLLIHIRNNHSITFSAAEGALCLGSSQPPAISGFITVLCGSAKWFFCDDRSDITSAILFCICNLILTALRTDEGHQGLAMLPWLWELTEPFYTPPPRWSSGVMGGGGAEYQSLFRAATQDLSHKALTMDRHVARGLRTHTERGVPPRRLLPWHPPLGI